MFVWSRLNIKMPILPKVIYVFIIILIKIPAGFFFLVLANMILNIIWKAEIARVYKMILEKKNQMGRLMLLDVKTYYEATVIETVGHL